MHYLTQEELLTAYKKANTRKNALIVLICVLTAFLFAGGAYIWRLGKAKAESDLNASNLGISNYELQKQIQTFKVEKEKDGKTIVTQGQVLADLHRRNTILSENVKRWKVKAMVKYTAEVRVDSIKVPYYITHTDTNNVAAVDSNESDCIPVGTEFFVEHQWYTIKGRLDPDNVFIQTIYFNLGNTTTTIGCKKGKEIVEIKSDSPFIKFNGVANAVHSEKSKLFNVSLVLGGGVTTDLKLGAFAGLAVGMTLFKF